MSFMIRLGSSLKLASRFVSSKSQPNRHLVSNFVLSKSQPNRHLVSNGCAGVNVWRRGVASAESSSSSFLPREVVQDRVLEVIRNFPKIDASKVNTSVHFKNDLAIDSLDQVELVMALEDEFNIEITDEEAEKIETADDAIRYITAHPMAK